MTRTHTPVLIEEAIQHLAIQPGGRYVDCTLGGGGHARAIMEEATPGGLLLGIDADPDAVATAAHSLAGFGADIKLVEANFRDLKWLCLSNTFVPVNGVLFDLGLSSRQLAAADRGFSFHTDAPLDMRFSPSQELTAADIINEYEERDLASLLWQYGEESAGRRIARALVKARPLSSTLELAAIISRTVPGQRGRIHPATRTFQALRIAVNDELGSLASALDQACDVLGFGGRLVTIAFHSLEDRIVKQFMQRESRDCICPPETPICICDHKATLKILTRKPIEPSAAEAAANPRSRSARLRAAEKITEAR